MFEIAYSSFIIVALIMSIDRVIIFLSDGQPTNNTEEEIINTIVNERSNSTNDILLLTYGVGNGKNTSNRPTYRIKPMSSTFLAVEKDAS